MPRMRIDKLGSIGLNTDVQPYLLPPQAWTKMINCSTQDGELRSAVGERKLFDLQIRPIYHTAFRSVSGVQYLIVSDGASVHAYTITGVGEDITPTTDETPVPWSGGVVSFTNLNGILVVNSRSDGPFYWGGPGTDLVALPGWNADWRCRQMVAYRYYLVAVNMSEGGNLFPHKVRWSGSAAEGELPTVWVAAPDNDAGSDLIGDTPGAIVGAEMVRDSLFVVKEDAVYDMHWIGGDFIMTLARMVGSSGGTRLEKGFTNIGGALGIFTTSDLIAFDGQAGRSLADQRIRSGLFTAISTELWEFSQLFYAVSQSILVVAIVDAGYRHLSRAFTLNLEENTWGVRQLHNGYGFDNALVESVDGVPTWDEMGPGVPYNMPEPLWTQGGTWDEQTDGTWNKGVYRPSTPDIIVYESSADDASWWVSVLAIGTGNHDGTAKYCMAERVAVPIGDASRPYMVTELWPEMRGEAPVTLWVGSQDAPNGSVRWDGPFPFKPTVDVHITPRVTGRFVSLRVESEAIGDWSFGAISMQYESAGDR